MKKNDKENKSLNWPIGCICSISKHFHFQIIVVGKWKKNYNISFLISANCQSKDAFQLFQVSCQRRNIKLFIVVLVCCWSLMQAVASLVHPIPATLVFFVLFVWLPRKLHTHFYQDRKSVV